MLLYDPEDEGDHLFTMADDGNGSAVRIPVLMLPRKSALALLEILGPADDGQGGGAPTAGGSNVPMIDLEGLEVTVRADRGEDDDEEEEEAAAAAAAAAKGGGAEEAGADLSVAMDVGTAVRCPAGGQAEAGCTKQYPIDPWSLDDSTWEAMRCSTSS